MNATYPKKLFYRIQEVANIVGVEPYVLRYWETKFPMLSPEKDGSDQRRYRQKDVELLLRIRQLLHVEKYTIAGAVEKLAGERGGRGRQLDLAGGEDPLEVPGGVPTPPPGAPPAPAAGLSEDQMQRVRRVREELGLLRRELENWRDELA